ncbi:MAG: hypothetical protein ABDH37_06660 [Candidatus Hydrothermales bacterium]
MKKIYKEYSLKARDDFGVLRCYKFFEELNTIKVICKIFCDVR